MIIKYFLGIYFRKFKSACMAFMDNYASKCFLQWIDVNKYILVE